MIIAKKYLDRRMFLKGLGAAIALPFLDAMIPAFARAEEKARPLRLAFCYAPNGAIMEHWRPSLSSDVAPLPETLPSIPAVLSRFRSEILMLDSLTNDPARAAGDERGGDHARASAAYLSCVHPRRTLGKDLRSGVSADQIAAGRVGAQTRFPSLELTCEAGLQSGGTCDAEFSCAYTNNLSWRTETTPLPAEIRPREVFVRLFGAGASEPDPVGRSILDQIGAEAKRLRSTLGAADGLKLDEYLDGLRDLEKRIDSPPGHPTAPPLGAPPSAVPEKFEDHARLMADLMVAAFQTDSTRVITWTMGFEASPRCYREIDIHEAHHALTHHRGDPAKIAKVAKINALHARMFGYLLDRLRSTPDGDGSLLDHSMIVFGSGLSDGNAHVYDHLPTLVAGKGNGTLTPGRFIRFPNETPLANLWVSLLDRMGMPGTQLGNSTGPLSGLGAG